MNTGKSEAVPYHHHHAHHYANAEAEYNATKFGMWVFLCSEILMFGGLFVAYAIYHAKFPQMFHAGSQFCEWQFGMANTIVLIISSFTMAMGIYFAQKNNKKMSLINLYTTVVLGAVFMMIKGHEYLHKFSLGLYPGKYFTYHGAATQHFHNMGMFFSFYFLMTGLHGIHVLVGMGLITWLIIRTHKGHFSSEYYTPLEIVGLFWHLVDIIWIYLFPLLYLIS